MHIVEVSLQTLRSYSSFPNKRAYARSCSKGKFPLCTSLLGTMHARCQVSIITNLVYVSNTFSQNQNQINDIKNEIFTMHI